MKEIEETIYQNSDSDYFSLVSCRIFILIDVFLSFLHISKKCIFVLCLLTISKEKKI